MTSAFSREQATLATLLTPVGRGAVATIGVRGSQAVVAIESVFRAANGKRLADAPVGRILFGVFTSSAGAAEELVVCRVAENEVEIHCHGGTAAAEAILQTLAAAGASTVAAESWLAKTQDDLIQAEAIAALAQATTERTAGILLDQYRGALRREVESILAELASAAPTQEQIPQEFVGTQTSRLAELYSRRSLGRHLTRPFRIVLAGQPNVGKSSLINALCGYQRAIVSPQPGTTRDVVTASTAFAGWPVELADTAGLRAARDELETAGIARTHEQLTRADLALIVVDHTAGWTAAEEVLHKRSRPSLVVYNKCDLPSQHTTGRPPGAEVSALTGHGLKDLEEWIVSRLGLLSLRPGDAITFTQRQEQWLGLAVNPDKPATITQQICLQQLLTNPLPPNF